MQERDIENDPEGLGTFRPQILGSLVIGGGGMGILFRVIFIGTGAKLSGCGPTVQNRVTIQSVPDQKEHGRGTVLPEATLALVEPFITRPV